MKAVRPWVTGGAFSAVAGAFYLVCAIAVVLFPEGTLAVFNSWAHGIDLSMIKRSTAAIGWVAWASGFVTAVVAGFCAGAIYGWALNLFGGLVKDRDAEPNSHVALHV